MCRRNVRQEQVDGGPAPIPSPMRTDGPTTTSPIPKGDRLRDAVDADSIRCRQPRLLHPLLEKGLHKKGVAVPTSSMRCVRGGQSTIRRTASRLCRRGIKNAMVLWTNLMLGWGRDRSARTAPAGSSRRRGGAGFYQKAGQGFWPARPPSNSTDGMPVLFVLGRRDVDRRHGFALRSRIRQVEMVAGRLQRQRRTKPAFGLFATQAFGMTKKKEAAGST